MSAVLNTNMASLYAQQNLSTAQSDLATSVQRLSSGKQINSAADNAAGFAVSQAITATKNQTDQSISNTQDAISMVQTASGALDVVGQILQRALTLTTQKADGTLTPQQTASINSELTSLYQEIGQVQQRTVFQGGDTSLFGKTLNFQTGAGVTTQIGIGSLSLATLASGVIASQAVSSSATGGTTSLTGSTPAAAGNFATVTGATPSTFELQVADQSGVLAAEFAAGNLTLAATVTSTGAAASTQPTISGVTENSNGTATVFLSSTAVAGNTYTFTNSTLNASSTSNALMSAIQTNSANQAALGTWNNRLNYAVSNMQTLSNNLASANSQIVDTNYAAETANLTRGQILQQAATSMLAQANQMPNVILTLLK